jgi:hypothetical protein
MTVNLNASMTKIALWQSYQQLSSSYAGGTGEGHEKIGLMKYLRSYFEGFFNMP